MLRDGGGNREGEGDGGGEGEQEDGPRAEQQKKEDPATPAALKGLKRGRRGSMLGEHALV